MSFNWVHHLYLRILAKSRIQRTGENNELSMFEWNDHQIIAFVCLFVFKYNVCTGVFNTGVFITYVYTDSGVFKYVYFIPINT